MNDTGQGLDVVPYTNSRAELSRTSERQLLEPMAGSAVRAYTSSSCSINHN